MSKLSISDKIGLTTIEKVLSEVKYYEVELCLSDRLKEIGYSLKQASEGDSLTSQQKNKLIEISTRSYLLADLYIELNPLTELNNFSREIEHIRNGGFQDFQVENVTDEMINSEQLVDYYCKKWNMKALLHG